MSTTGEIVTIQAGNYANFIGAHWWNLQESSFCYVRNSCAPLDINHDILFREGENFKGEITYTPRLVLIDLKDSVKSVKKELSLSSNPVNRSEALWDGPVDILRGESFRRLNQVLEVSEGENTLSDASVAVSNENFSNDSSNVVHDFESRDTVWSDFLKTSLHPRSYCLLNDQRSIEDEDPLELYSAGEAAYKSEGKEMIEDSLRKITEECDYLQGFQLIFDAYDGFSGITNRILQHFNEEYHRKPTLCFPVFQINKSLEKQEDQKSKMHRLYSILTTMSNLNSYSSLFSPLCLNDDVIALDGPFQKFPYIHYNETSLYQNSAILAASIESLTSQYRLKSLKFQLSHITETMSLCGRKLVSSKVSLPFPMNEDLYLSSMVDNSIPEYFMSSLTPFSDPNERSIMQYAVLRGIPYAKFNASKSPYQGLSPEDLFGQYLNNYSSSSVTVATTFEEKLSVSDPFPNFFNSAININGHLSAMPRLPEKVVSKIPVSACLHNSDKAAEFLQSLLTPASTRNFKVYVNCTNNGIEKDDYNEILQNVMGLQENYQDY